MKHTTNSSVRPRTVGKLASAIAVSLMLPAMSAAADQMPEPNIVQSRGVDQSVDYSGLVRFGKWDDRNYQLTAADLAYLSKDEAQLTNQIPAFFRVELRKAWPHLQKSGAAQYPRAAWQMFRMKYGGFERDGKVYGPKWGVDRLAAFRADNELQLNQVLGANELTVEVNHTNPDQVIAGSNNNGGQEMYFSSDGGQSWTIQGTLPNTCCDPTVGWSSDGSVAYAAALSGPIGVSFWRSFDAGQTWVDRIDITPNGSDKEWLHVDISDASAFQDSIYLTYHNGNVMQFARSTDGGASFDITAFPGENTGIGSDITTTSNGDIYYGYGAFGAQAITVLKSTDGGDSFTSSDIASTNGSFDWPIPAMDSRNAWIYVTMDSDRTGGTFDGSVYAAWTDVTAPESGNPADNHTVVNVAYSRDGGATWNISNPHPTDDTDSVDRFNQWMTVDEFGTVHAVFYDTRNSLNRTGTDLYYSFSTDGAQTWSEPERVSSATSANLTDGQEWGDYNGISVVGEKIVTVWTDNRDGPPNAKDGFAATLINAGASPSFTLGAAGAGTTTQAVCAPGNLDDITLAVGQIQDFTSPVSLSFSGLPTGFSGGFSDNPVTPATPANTSTASVSVGAVAAGTYSFAINGVAAGVDPRNVGVEVTVSDAVPAAASLSAPADGSPAESTNPIFTWDAVAQGASYLVEVDDDPAFGSVDFSTTTSATSATLSGSLGPLTTYYWRVTASNPCGSGATSAVSSFTTIAEICSMPNLFVDGNVVEGNTASTVLSEAGTIASLDVKLKVDQTWVGDLTFTLTHEDTGTQVTIMDRPGVPASQFGCDGTNVDATFTDSSTTPVETTCLAGVPAIGGELQPDEPLAAFNGEDIGGTWTITGFDGFPGADEGTLTEWCLLPTFETGADSDGDGVADAADNCTLVPNADQRDTNGDGFGNICDADLNNDNVVNFIDLGQLRSVFFTADADADLNGDGSVNFVDLGIMRASFFGPPGPSGVAP